VVLSRESGVHGLRHQQTGIVDERRLRFVPRVHGLLQQHSMQPQTASNGRGSNRGWHAKLARGSRPRMVFERIIVFGVVSHEAVQVGKLRFERILTIGDAEQQRPRIYVVRGAIGEEGGRPRWLLPRAGACPRSSVELLHES
jgi:hypothetical protein